MLQSIVHITIGLGLGALALVEVILLVHLLFEASFLAVSTLWCLGVWAYILEKKGVPFP